ncbi:MAG: ATP-binding cassette domain-containing protein [Verrucomicrobia bacterium]|nr:ATP-binding cassette domain-containing protein [Verrucomicrobiota bacterium]
MSHTQAEVHTQEPEVLVRVEHVSKKFCRTLKRSLWYGAKDIASELNPFPQAKITSKQTQMSPPSESDLRKGEFWALQDVSFELRRGECLGLIGHNGAGKSTLLKILNGIIKPDRGRAEIRGRVGALIELGAGFNPVLTGRENIYNKGAVLGFTKKAIDRKLDAIVNFAEISEFIDMPVQNYSSGMRVRLGFAVSAHMEPDVLIIDEVLAVGDLGFRIKCLNAVSELTRDAAVIFVSHSMPMISRISSHIMLLDRGRVESYGTDIAHGLDCYFSRFTLGEYNVSGTGQVRLLRIYADGQLLKPGDTPSLPYGGPFSFHIELSTDTDLQKMRIAAIIWNQELRPVADLVDEEGQSFVFDTPASGRCKCSFELPVVHLNAGKHSLAIVVSNPNTDEIYLRVDNALSMTVCLHKTSWADVILPCKGALQELGEA